MKKKILLASNAVLIAVIFCACQNKIKHKPVIIRKSYFTEMGNPLMKGICRYGYTETNDMEEITFTDSCYKYNIGDTIIGAKK